MMIAADQGFLDFPRSGRPLAEECLAVVPSGRRSGGGAQLAMNRAPKGPSLQERAAALRASADVAAIARELAARPAAADIPAIQNYSLAPFLKGMPPEPSRQAKYLLGGLAEAHSLLEKQSARYETVRRDGLAAISDFDLVMGYSVAKPLQGLWLSLRNLTGHITYARSMITAITNKIAADQTPQA